MNHNRPRRHWRGKLILFLLVLCTVSVLAQVFWPGKKLMAFTKIGGVNVANLTLEEARTRIADIFTDHTLAVEAADGTLLATIPVPLEAIAIDTMIQSELDYPLWQRLIPFSSIARIFRASWVGANVNLEPEQILTTIPTTPVNAHIAIIDGTTTITKSQPGVRLDHADFAQRLANLRLENDGETSLVIPTETTQPDVTDADIAHLTAKSPDQIYPSLTKAFRGSDLSISAASLDGTWSISLNDKKTWTSASTYKLFVAHFILKKTDTGELSYDSIQPCLERTIVDSDNACPEHWIAEYGASNINTIADAIGSLESNLIADDNMETSAHDLSLFLGKLYRGELLSETSTTRLLDLMKRQTHRDGIPAGVGNDTVADKPGWLYSLLHDTAIVYSPSGDYIVTIMTNGSSWSNLASLATIIDNFNNK